MMEKYLFKAYDQEKNRMYYEDELEENENLTSFLSYGQLYIYRIENGDYVELIPLISSGIKDVNKRNVYKGDILESNGNTFLVTYKDYGFRMHKIYDSWLKKNVFHTDERTWLSPLFVESMTMIGNMYEDPELLKQDK